MTVCHVGAVVQMQLRAKRFHDHDGLTREQAIRRAFELSKSAGGEASADEKGGGA